MSCKTLILNSCEIKGSTFNARVFNFGSRDTSGDTFTAKVLSRYGTFIQDLVPTRIGSIVYFPISELEDFIVGTYTIEYWATFAGLGTEIIGHETFVISKTPRNCSGSGDSINYTLEIDNTSIEYNVLHSIVNINNYLDFENLTPEQKLELTGPQGDPFEYEDFTPEQLLELKGEQGIQGDKGNVGDQGIQGEKGDKGDKGDIGEKGDKGEQGEKGAQGIQGLQGIQGVKGDDGISVSVIQATDQADAISLSATNPNNIYFWV